MSEFGRIDDDGTVYVRTPDGERAVGSWQAGTPEEGLAHFARRYEVISTEVALLEQRLRSGAGDPQQVAQSATRLKATVPTAAAVGDLAGLERRVDALLEKTADAVEAGKAAKAEARARAAEAKTGLAEEAERLAGTSDWKASGERLRTIGDDWKRMPHLERKAEDELWQRIAAARKRFTERRTTHFAALEQQRTVSQERKEKLIAEAESLSSSTEWGPTAGRYKALMTEWKTAGRAPREVEDSLWNRFKAAQDAFFTARNAHFSVQDEELRGNQKVKEEILAEAETIDPAQGVDKAKSRLRVAAGPLGGGRQGAARRHALARGPHGRRRGQGARCRRGPLRPVRRVAVHRQAAREGRRAGSQAGEGTRRRPPDRRARGGPDDAAAVAGAGRRLDVGAGGTRCAAGCPRRKEEVHERLGPRRLVGRPRGRPLSSGSRRPGCAGGPRCRRGPSRRPRSRRRAARSRWPGGRRRGCRRLIAACRRQPA